MDRKTNMVFYFHVASEQALCLGKKIARKIPRSTKGPLPSFPLDQRPVHRLTFMTLALRSEDLMGKPDVPDFYDIIYNFKNHNGLSLSNFY